MENNTEIQVFKLWKVKFIYNISQQKVFGPYCPICNLILTFKSNYSVGCICSDCNKKFELPMSKNYILIEALKRVNAKILSQYPVINLDLPPTKLEVYSKDENYF